MKMVLPVVCILKKFCENNYENPEFEGASHVKKHQGCMTITDKLTPVDFSSHERRNTEKVYNNFYKLAMSSFQNLSLLLGDESPAAWKSSTASRDKRSVRDRVVEHATIY